MHAIHLGVVMASRQIVQEGCVESVRVTPFGFSRSVELDVITAIVGQGIKGDKHWGERLTDAREEVLLAIGVPKDVEMAAVRQYSAVALEDLLAIGAAMGAPGPVEYGDLAENLVFSGITGLSSLAPGTLLTFTSETGGRVRPRKTVLAVWDENDPCYGPEANIVETFSTSEQVFKPARHFVPAARNRRGVVGFTYCSGKIKKGDIVHVWQRR